MIDVISIGAYELPADCYYHPDHFWLRCGQGDRVWCGLDPLGSSMLGDVVAVSFENVGTMVQQGESFGNLEAAKFVGPLIAPISGTVQAHNETVLGSPGLLNEAPLTHWLVMIEVAAADEELASLMHGEAQVRPWFEAEILRLEERGVLAE